MQKIKLKCHWSNITPKTLAGIPSYGKAGHIVILSTFNRVQNILLVFITVYYVQTYLILKCYLLIHNYYN